MLLHGWIYVTVSQEHFASEGTDQQLCQFMLSKGEIKRRIMGMIMNPMPALIATILDSLKCAVAAGYQLPCPRPLH